MSLNRGIMLASTFVLSTQVVFGSINLKDYPKNYPFVPAKIDEIYSDVATVTEDKNFMKKFDQIIEAGLSKANTDVKPWSGSYWPLSKGTIADPYEDTIIEYYVDAGWVVWKSNYRSFKDRLKDVLSKVDSMSESELAKLAPSEKYDLLLGDKSFDLTKRLWEYMNDWGSNKRNAFITDLRLVDENALALAQKYVSWGWYKTVDDAFRLDYELQGGLSVENALMLVQMGKYTDVESAFPEAVEMALKQKDDFTLTETSKFMAAWEGICNGWSTAAGAVPRPRKSIKIKLPNGKNLKFYPVDIQGLASLYWVNSFIQNNLVIDQNGNYQRGGTVSAGLRCNVDVKEDSYGRLYDSKTDPFSGLNADGQRDARCSGVHPAKWHMGLVNIIGKQGRSFVVERKVGEAVDNHPMYAYDMKYFNPNTGKEKSNPMDAVVKIDKEDQFKNLRHKNAKYIVGVETTMTYLNYIIPKRENSNSEKDDENIDKTMFYDLELDKNLNIVGGQWRAVKTGKPRYRFDGAKKKRVREDVNHNQPDFFWSVTKNWKDTGLFDDHNDIEPWSDKSVAPPKSWLARAKEMHAFMYMEKYSFMTGQKCIMRNKKTGQYRNISCEKEINKPQPLSNVLNALVELSQ